GFTPLPPVTVRPDVAWPQGDAPPQGNWPAEVDKAALDHAVDLAFAPDAQTAAFLVLYHGRILAERYGAGITARTRLPGWSMTKTLQATLVGALEQDRRLKLFEPAPIAEWSGASDPRRLITLADLLRMSAPISCGRGLNQPKGWFDHAAWRRDGYPESLYVFSGPDDTYAYSINRPPLAPDELRGGYKNCQPDVVGHIVQQELRKTGETVAGYATAKVFAPLGIGSMVLEPDAWAISKVRPTAMPPRATGPGSGCSTRKTAFGTGNACSRPNSWPLSALRPHGGRHRPMAGKCG
ncbi:MAG: serine hydrolase, partial [Bradyrhizobium sp.]